MQEARGRPAALERGAEGPQGQMPVVGGTHGPADDEAGVQVEDRGEMELAATGDGELRSVADPTLIGRGATNV
jgi:hypothetical protein